MVYIAEGSECSTISQHGDQILELALEADQTLVRKGGFLVVEGVLRPYRWPGKMTELFMAKINSEPIKNVPQL